MMNEGESASALSSSAPLGHLRARRDDILRLARRNGVRSVRVFGSVARGEADADSDIDLLVEIEEGRSLLDLGAFLMDMQELLGTRVDVVTSSGLSSRVREQVEREAVSL